MRTPTFRELGKVSPATPHNAGAEKLLSMLTLAVQVPGWDQGKARSRSEGRRGTDFPCGLLL